MSKVIALVSGGVDSPALMYALAKKYPETTFDQLYFCSRNSGAYWQREHGSNVKVYNLVKDKFPNVLPPQQYNSPEIRVSRGRTEYRNQIFLDAVVRLYDGDKDVEGIMLGVVPAGASGDWWIHGWFAQMGAGDHSPDFLQDYLHKQKPGWKLWTFKDFANGTFPMNDRRSRVRLGVDALGEDWLWETVSCQRWFLGTKPGIYSYLGEGIQATGGCGECFSCVERSMAIYGVLGYDKTPYRHDPLKSRWYLQYAVGWKDIDFFIRGLPCAKDGMPKREVLAWLQRRLNE